MPAVGRWRRGSHLHSSSFLETLNTTVLTELRQFRVQYDQIWQSTILELSAQRELSQREVTALSQRLSLLADEILWQKRLAMFQFGLIMLCLGLVLFSRTASGSPAFDMPLLQNMVSRPSTSFARYLNLESPPRTPSRPSSRYKRLARSWQHFRSPSNPSASDDEGLKADSQEAYQLPTPSSEIDEPRLGLSPDSHLEPELTLRHTQSTPNLGTESDLLESEIDDDLSPPGSQAYRDGESVSPEADGDDDLMRAEANNLA